VFEMFSGTKKVYFIAMKIFFRKNYNFQMFLSQDFYTGGLLPHIRLAHSEDTACGRVRLMVIQDKALISQKLVEIR